MIRWTDITPSDFPHERRALEFLKRSLPETEPYRAWGPFIFDSDGQFPEVDCLVVASHAVFLIEIKSYHGELTGNSMKWTLASGYSDPRSFDNPRLSANSKSKKLLGKLQKTKALKGKKMPWIQALVFLSEEDFTCRLPDDARDGITGLGKGKHYEIDQGGGLPGVVETIERFKKGNSNINAELSESISDAMDGLHITPSDRFKKISGTYQLGDKRSEDSEMLVYTAAHSRKLSLTYGVSFYKSIPTPDYGDDRRARRAARREFDLLSPRETRHPGLPDAVDFDDEHPLGPAVVYEADPDALRLDEFLESKNVELVGAARTDLWTRLIDAVQYANKRNMFHRALRPSVIFVHKAADGHYQPVVTGWHTGLRLEALGTGLTAVAGSSIGTSDDTSLLRYRAPEAATASNPNPRLLDVFSLGALGYFIMTGTEPPVDTLETLESSGGMLDPRTVRPDLNEDMSEVIAWATNADAHKRLDSAEEMFGLLQPQAAPAAPEPARGKADPPEADAADARDSDRPMEAIDFERIAVGATIDRFKIIRRLPRGSTAVALLAIREDGQQGVLKIAADAAHNERVAQEGKTLKLFHDHTVVELYEAPFQLGDRTALFLQEATGGTLREDLLDGDSSSDLRKERLGEALIDALRHLEDRGVFHRDIKPENLGLSTLGAAQTAEQLMLFDFSLTGAPDTELQLGTVPYLDPFLGLGDRDLYDHAADRYAAAAVLHEILTGQHHKWGDGVASPRFSDCELLLRTDLFPEESATELTTFFERAMARNVEDRFGDARELSRAWQLAWHGGERPVNLSPPVAIEEDANKVDRELSATANGHDQVGAEEEAVASSGAARAEAGAGTGGLPQDTSRSSTDAVLSVELEGSQLTAKIHGSSLSTGDFLALKDSIKAIEPKPRWDPADRVWRITLTPRSATALREITESWQSTISTDARTALDPTNGRPAGEPDLRLYAIVHHGEPVPKLDDEGFDAGDLTGADGEVVYFPDETDLQFEISEWLTADEHKRALEALKPVAVLDGGPHLLGPKDIDFLDRLTAEWNVEIGEAAAAAVAELRAENESSALPSSTEDDAPRPSDGAVVLGKFTLSKEPRQEPFTGSTPGKEKDVKGTRLLFNVAGPEGLELEVADERFDNGERQIRLNESGPVEARFSRLYTGCRLGVHQTGALTQIELRQARMTTDDWSSTRNASFEKLDEGAGIGVKEALAALGASTFGTRAELTDDTSPRKNTLCALFPPGADLVPVAAYVMTRVSPVYLRMQA